MYLLYRFPPIFFPPKGVASTYAGYGRLVARRSLALFLLGLVLATIACIGLVNLQTTNDVLDIWM